MATSFNDFANKALIGAVLRNRLAPVTQSGIILIPNPVGGSFDPGIEQGTIEEADCEGVTTTVKRFTVKRQSKVTINISSKNGDVIGLRLGREMKKAAAVDTEDVDSSSFDVPPSGVVPAASIGQMGKGILANAPAKASYQNEDGFSESLTQDPAFATFDAEVVASAKKFAIGADGAMKFGTAARGRRVAMEIAFPGQAFYNLGGEFVSLALKVIGVNQLLQQTVWTFPDVSIEPGAVDLKEPAQELSFFVNGGYDYRVRQLTNICRHK